MASGVELAKAYVQIVPSAKGIKGSITEALGGEADSAGGKAGEAFGSKMVGGLKKVLAAAGIGAAIKASIDEGAALQQSLGGIDTLFKDNADTMKKYAAEAYKTAGLSANEYMETATGFAASLLQGLGGDTAKAAEAANTAITDMSDNANKMGTSMESIQFAYQGFAKQNYTMLDNLKLGYGGTKEEMARLLADAQKISGVKYDMSNLSDVYEAIHVIQGELGITGTTAKEAASTLSGSMASMKSAFTNLLGNLALGEDIEPSLMALSDSVFTFMTGNLIPMVANILKSLPQALSGVLSAVIRMMNITSNNAGQIVQMGIDLISQLVVGVISAAPYLVEAAVNLVTSLGSALLNADWATLANNMMAELRENMTIAAGEILGTDGNIISSVLQYITAQLPGFLQKGIEIISNLASGILSNLPTIIESMGQIMTRLIDFILQNIPVILQSGVTLIQNLAVGVLQNAPAVISSMTMVLDQILTTITNQLPQILQSGITLIKELAQGFIQNLPEAISSMARVLAELIATIAKHLPQLLQSGIKILGELAAGLIQAIPQLVAKIPEIISSIVKAFLQFDWLSLGADILSGIANGIKEGASAIIEAAKNAAKAALDAAKEFLGIKSPSKVMKEEVGRWIPAGVAEGIKEYTKQVTMAMKELSAETTGTLQADLALGVSRGQHQLNQSHQRGQIQQSGGYTQNLTINSPKELTPSEVARLTRNATQNMVLALKGVSHG